MNATKKERAAPAKPAKPLQLRLTPHRRRLLRKYAKADDVGSATWAARVVSMVLDEREKREKAARQLHLFAGGGVGDA